MCGNNMSSIDASHGPHKILQALPVPWTLSSKPGRGETPCRTSWFPCCLQFFPHFWAHKILDIGFNICFPKRSAAKRAKETQPRNKGVNLHGVHFDQWERGGRRESGAGLYSVILRYVWVFIQLVQRHPAPVEPLAGSLGFLWHRSHSSKVCPGTCS